MRSTSPLCTGPAFAPTGSSRTAAHENGAVFQAQIPQEELPALQREGAAPPRNRPVRDLDVIPLALPSVMHASAAYLRLLP